VLKLAYLASPYSHADPEVMRERYVAVCRKAAELMLAGKVIFCPIAHSHPIAERMPEGCAVDHDLWVKQDAPYLEMCDELIVLMLPGWAQSRGIAHEVKIAQFRGIPIRYIEP
jgi:hypothetical protein